MKQTALFAVLLSFCCVAACTSIARAQEASGAEKTKEEPINAERPGFTNGTGTVPVGQLQFETGYLYTRGDGGAHEHRIGDSALFRIPTGPNTEFRIGPPVYSFTHSGQSGSGANTHGFGDTNISEKWRFLDEEKPLTRPSLSLTVQTSLPTGEPAYRETHLQPQIELDAAFDLSESWTLQSNVLYARPADEGQQFSQWAGAINIQHNVTEATAVFLETYRISPTGASAPNGNYLDGGITHVLGNNTQFDINLGTGLNSSVKHDQFVGFGVARRW